MWWTTMTHHIVPLEATLLKMHLFPLWGLPSRMQYEATKGRHCTSVCTTWDSKNMKIGKYWQKWSWERWMVKEEMGWPISTNMTYIIIFCLSVFETRSLVQGILNLSVLLIMTLYLCLGLTFCFATDKDMILCLWIILKHCNSDSDTSLAWPYNISAHIKLFVLLSFIKTEELPGFSLTQFMYLKNFSYL